MSIQSYYSPKAKTVSIPIDLLLQVEQPWLTYLLRLGFFLFIAVGIYNEMPPYANSTFFKQKTNLTGYTNPGGTQAGYTMGTFGVGDGGHASYSIPIKVAPGTAGMQPTLAMVFGSSNGNSILGKDWAVSGFSAISRSGHTKEQDGYIRNVKVDSLDTYSLDGERLWAVNGTYGANGTEYRTEQINFSKVISYGNYLGCPTDFKVWTKSGLIYEYGNTNGSPLNSRIEAEGSNKTMFWCLNKITDTKGNYMTFHYGESNGEYYPLQVSYTGNASAALSPYAYIDFVYKASRVDNTERYVNGYRIPQTKLLDKITCKYGTTTVREYQFTYNNGTFNDVSLLESVKECGKNGACLDPVTFHWSTENRLGFTKITNNPLTNNPILDNLGTHGNTLGVSSKSYLLNGDVNADGRNDILRIDPYNGYNRWYVNTEQGGYFDFSTASFDNHIASDELKNTQTALVASDCAQQMAAVANPNPITLSDVNADGYSDVVVVRPKFTGTCPSTYLPMGLDCALGAACSSCTGCNNDTLAGPFYTELNIIGNQKNNTFAKKALSDSLNLTNYNKVVQGLGFVAFLRGDINNAQTNNNFKVKAQYGQLMTSDFDGDGRTDFFINKYNKGLNSANYTDNTKYSILLYKEDALGRYYPTIVNIPTNIIPIDTNSNASLFPINFNDDNLPDLLYYNKTTGVNLLYVNQWNGTTLSFAPGIQLITPANIAGGNGLDYGDFNADGNTDILWWNSVTGSTRFFVNKGNTQVFQQTLGLVMPSADSIKGGGTELSVRDFNSDGYADLYWYNPANGTNRWYMNKAWNFTTPLNIAQSPSVPGYRNAIQAADLQNKPILIEGFSNRGLTDLMSYYFATPNNLNIVTSSTWYRNNITMFHQMDSIHTGNGASIQIEYAPITVDSVYEKGTNAVYPDYDYRGSYYVVASYSTEDGLGGRNRMKYKYKGARMNMGGRGFRGFTEVNTIDMTTNMTTKKVFETDYRLTGSVKRVQTLLNNGTPSQVLLSDAIYYNKQRPYIYNNLPVNHVTFSYIDTTISRAYDLNGQLLSTNTTFNVANDYGDVTKNITYFGNGNIDSTVTTYDYNATNLSNWILGRMTRADLYRHRADGSSIHRASAFDYEAGTGRLIREISEPDSGSLRKITTEYTYNQVGNTTQKRTIAWNGTQTEHRYANQTYDALGRFLLSISNELGHTASKTYDVSTGLVLTETDANGLVTTNSYDNMGRLLSTENADGTWTAWDIRKCAGNCPLEATTYMVTQSSNHPQSETSYDVLGREVQMKFKSFDNTDVYEYTKYNKRGQVKIETLPSDLPIYSSNIPKNVFLYDTLGRVITKQSPLPGGGVGSLDYNFAYNGYTKITTNPLGQTEKEVKNDLGQLVAVFDNQNHYISYKYDAAGNNTHINHNGISVVSTYDHFGRKIQMSEPHLGTIRYKYNSFGELLQQIDADNDTISMKYDSLGRTIQRIEKEGTTNWVYDTRPSGIGMLSQVTAPQGYQYDVFYDVFSRVTSETVKIDSTNYTTGYAYDAKSRLQILTYPTGLQVQNIYNSQGFLERVKNPATNFTYWQINNVNVWGQITDEFAGNNVTTNRTFDTGTGWLKAVHTTNLQNTDIQDFQYTYNGLGNLTQRSDLIRNYSENFTYDNLNRLTESKINGVFDVEVTYTAGGNIKTKSDVGTYYYNDPTKPFQLTGIDAVQGACIPTFQNSIRYNSYQMVKSIRRATDSMTIDYGPSRQRIVQKTFQNNVLKEKKIYVSSLYEKEVTDTTMREMVYIRGAGGVVAVENKRTLLSTNAVTNYTDYWHKDHLGSLQSVTNSSGQKVAEYNYDAWGKRRNLDGSAMPITFALNGNRYDRGFTGHEHIDLFGLINMNGRVYDPVLGRFLSPDPVFEDIGDYQSMNRYSYVRNNPLNRTDPSGFKSWRKSSVGRMISKSIQTSINSAKKSVGYAMSAGKNLARGNFKDGLRDLGRLALSPLEEAYEQVKVVNGWGMNTFGAKTWMLATTIAITCATGGAGTLGGVILAGAASGFAQGVLATASVGGSFSDAMKSGLKAGAISAVMAAATFGVGQYAKGSGCLEASIIKGIGHGVVQGVYQEATGGNFSSGFISGAATGVLSGSGLMESITSTQGKVLAGALVGGLSSELGGGEFSNGAISGAFVAMYNCSSKQNEGSCWDKAAKAFTDAYGYGPSGPNKIYKLELKQNGNNNDPRITESNKDYYNPVNKFNRDWGNMNHDNYVEIYNTTKSVVDHYLNPSMILEEALESSSISTSQDCGYDGVKKCGE